MEKGGSPFVLIVTLILALGFTSFVLCMLAEFGKAKREDLKWDGEFCYVPETRAFELGIAALLCLVFAQIIANVVMCRRVWLGDKAGDSKVETTTVAGRVLLTFSWISFGLAVLLLSAAASMNHKQLYGAGWLDSECYLVKNGVFAGSGGLALLSAGAALGALALNTTIPQIKNKDLEKVHAQGVRTI